MRSIFFFLAVIGLLFSCHKEEKSPYIGKAIASRNGAIWRAYVYESTFKNDSNEVDITLAVADKDDIIREKLIFSNMPLTPGKYFLDDSWANFNTKVFGAYFVTSIDDGDVTGDEYFTPKANPDNYVVVDYYDNNSNELSCRFKMLMVMGPWRPKYDQSLPDTLVFDGGTFNIKLKR